MKRADKEKYLKIVEEKLGEVRKRLGDLIIDRSPSISESQHEAIRENVQKEINVQEDVLQGLEKFKEFLQSSTEKSQIEEGAKFTVKFIESGDVIEDAIFAPLSVRLEGVQIITAKSPLGAAIFTKKENDGFNYEAGDRIVYGKILTVQ